MKKLTAETIIQKFLDSARIVESVAMTTDYRTNNREVKKVSKLTLLLKDDIELAKEVYSCLINNSNPTVQVRASVDCLKLNIYVAQAEKNLEQLSKRDDIGIRSLGAEMALKVWRGEVPGKTL